MRFLISEEISFRPTLTISLVVLFSISERFLIPLSHVSEGSLEFGKIDGLLPHY